MKGGYLIHTKYPENEKLSLKTIGDRILQGFFQATNQNDYSYIPKLYARSAIIHTLDGEKTGPDVIIDICKKWKVAFPDFQLEPLFLIQEDDVLVIHWRGTGTFTHQLRDIQPTGKKTTVHGFTCFRCFNNQIIEHWARVDYRSLSQ